MFCFRELGHCLWVGFQHGSGAAQEVITPLSHRRMQVLYHLQEVAWSYRPVIYQSSKFKDRFLNIRKAEVHMTAVLVKVTWMVVVLNASLETQHGFPLLYCLRWLMPAANQNAALQYSRVRSRSNHAGEKRGGAGGMSRQRKLRLTSPTYKSTWSPNLNLAQRTRTHSIRTRGEIMQLGEE